ncbi:hypothetical protein [Burkholderia savannae]|uniref:hypothetical protein n=1 Tax=Burkholderia savannae TaxID=1637837 RepID=UPI0009EA0FF7|nr:hypothetical protein [Burkholderia savannae]
MPSAASIYRFTSAFALSVFCASAAHAQALSQPSPVVRLSDVTQFGVPRDSTYIFCDGVDCPDRSTKHLYVEQPAEPRYVEEEIDVPLSHAKVKPKKAAKKFTKKAIRKSPHKKPAIKYQCTPVTSK